MTLPSDPRLMIPVLRTALPKLMAQDIIGVQPMSSDTGSIFGKLASEVFNKKYWPHQYYVNYLDRCEVERWCYDNFKSRNWNSYRNLFALKRKEDAMLFALRWGT
jgi:hypothetical protein